MLTTKHLTVAIAFHSSFFHTMEVDGYRKLTQLPHTHGSPRHHAGEFWSGYLVSGNLFLCVFPTAIRGAAAHSASSIWPLSVTLFFTVFIGLRWRSTWEKTPDMSLYMLSPKIHAFGSLRRHSTRSTWNETTTNRKVITNAKKNSLNVWNQPRVWTLTWEAQRLRRNLDLTEREAKPVSWMKIPLPFFPSWDVVVWSTINKTSHLLLVDRLLICSGFSLDWCFKTQIKENLVSLYSSLISQHCAHVPKRRTLHSLASVAVKILVCHRSQHWLSDRVSAIKKEVPSG